MTDELIDNNVKSDNNNKSFTLCSYPLLSDPNNKLINSYINYKLYKLNYIIINLYLFGKYILVGMYIIVSKCY